MSARPVRPLNVGLGWQGRRNSYWTSGGSRVGSGDPPASRQDELLAVDVDGTLEQRDAFARARDARLHGQRPNRQWAQDLDGDAREALARIGPGPLELARQEGRRWPAVLGVGAPGTGRRGAALEVAREGGQVESRRRHPAIFRVFLPATG